MITTGETVITTQETVITTGPEYSHIGGVDA